MEELAKLEAVQGNLEYLEGERSESSFRELETGRYKQVKMHSKGDFGRSGSRHAGNEM